MAAKRSMGVLEDHVFRIEDFRIDQKEKVTTMEVMATRSDRVFGLGDGATSVDAALV